MSVMELPADVAAALGIDHEPGWIGGFTRRQEPGMLANGTRIVKIREDKAGDLTPLGTRGTVLGSIRPPGMTLGGYFVEWDGRPHCATFMIEWKIEAVHELV